MESSCLVDQAGVVTPLASKTKKEIEHHVLHVQIPADAGAAARKSSSSAVGPSDRLLWFTSVGRTYLDTYVHMAEEHRHLQFSWV